MKESRNIDNKSIAFLRDRKTDWDELAKDCVCFANAQGGFIFIGIADKDDLPPPSQRITDRNLPDIIQKNIAHRTVNVAVAVTIQTAENHGEMIRIEVLRSAQTIASTTDGRYYVRVHDECTPIPPDEMARLAADKNAFVWELKVNKNVPADQIDFEKRDLFLKGILTSPRVSQFIKEKSDEEILEHYFFQKSGFLTNLGILWIGKRSDRSALLYPPSVQVIRYNDLDEKVWKLVLDDSYANPLELLQRIESEVPDWQESFEISDGLFRKNIPFYDLKIVRELVVNALVHRSYTTRGDIFINIYTDRMEIHSPGRLPYGVTPENILSQSIRRNEHLSKVFYDLGLMEKEGSGYDLVYATLLTNGKPPPIVKERDDRVVVTVKKQFVSQDIVRLMDRANDAFPLKQKERITLGILAQHASLSAIELSRILNQNGETGLYAWMGRLLDLELVVKSGRGKGTHYAVNPEFIRKSQFKQKTSLKSIADHRLEELLFTDIKGYPNSSFGEIHRRIGLDINLNKVRRVLREMVANGDLIKQGEKRGTKYIIKRKD